MRTLTIVLALCVSSAALADELPAEVKKTVDAFAGKWKLDTTMTMGGKATRFVETIDCTKGALGRAVTCIDRADVPGMGKIEYLWLVSYDAETKTVHAFAVGSPGEVHDHKATWNGNTLAFQPLKATMGGQPITEELTMTFDGNRCAMKGTTTTKEGPITFEAAGKRGK